MIMVHVFYQPTDLRAITVRDELTPILGNLNTTEWSFVGPLYWTIAPTICEYLVCFAVIWGPFLQAFGVPVADFARCGPVIISQYPVAEAFLVIFMFKS
ncbi:unnamed protein product, partial [Mesorhabditis belari]|uniref:Uncharacterized protein n=1 Tax=Mesorhabditis belari TaxID=2138241 RepID=A0AAF3J4P6_9BILA